MKKILIVMLLWMNIYAEDGIIIPVCDKYMSVFYPSLAWLRVQLKSTLPIEIWHSGNELSEVSKAQISKFGNIEFHDIAEVRGGDPKEYRGYQIKPFALAATKFDRVILVDADVFLFLEPRHLFELPQFIATGAFFFRDTNNKHYSSPSAEIRSGVVPYSQFELRKKFYLSKIEKPSPYLPNDWRYFWDGEMPADNNPKIAELMESGVVVMDKTMHQKGIEEIVKLNEDWRVTYLHVLGDKETFWMGMEIANEPYYVNDKFPYRLFGGIKPFRKSKHKVDLVHHIGTQLIYQQKPPIVLGFNHYYYYPSSREETFAIPYDDLAAFVYLRYFYERYAYDPSQ